MSSANIVTPSLQAGRRFHARRRVDGLSYVEFGPDNGAILIDVGEGGLGFQSVLPVMMNQALLFKFKLPTKSTFIEGFAEVAWINESGKGGGLRFVELSADGGEHIREWTGVLSAPDAHAVRSGNTASNAPQEKATGEAPALSLQESTTTETEQSAESRAQIGEVVSAETAATADVSLETDSPSPSDESGGLDEAGKDVQAQQDALPAAPAIPEFTIEITPAAEATRVAPTLIEWAPATAAAGSEFRESAQPPSAQRGSDVVKTIGAPEAPVAPAGTPKNFARVLASDDTHFAPAKKIASKRQAPARPESPLPPAYRQDAVIRESLVRKQQRSVRPTEERESTLASREGELNTQATLTSQTLKIGIGAAAGACLVLLLVAIVPSLRTRVQATGNAKTGGPILSSFPGFQIEVADLNNRRWILRSGGDAGSPFSDASSRRETPSAGRNESKSSRAEDNEDASDAVSAPQLKLRRPAQLALAKPRTSPAGPVSAQLMPPSIFDGITPPIGSMSDRLAAGGPAAPGIVQAESQPGVRTSALQSAVLVQRVAPVYPSNALASRLEGEVLVNATIGTDGVPKNLKVVSGDQRLIPAALNAIAQWRYRPATLGGQAIETQTVITVAFHLK